MKREIETAPPKSSRVTALILFIIFSFAITILVWQWADRQGHIVGIKRTMAEYLTNVDFLGKRPRQLMAEVSATTEETQKQLSKLNVEAIASHDQQETVEKLSNLIEKIDTLPFAMDAHLINVDLSLEQLIPIQDHRWHKFINDIWQDLQQLIVIQKIDNSNIELLSPSQRDLIRENIKLQLLLAQFSLLSQNQTNFQANLEKAINWINRYYDKHTESVIDLLNELDQLHSYAIDETLPNVSERLDTVRNYRLIRNEEDE